MKLLSKILVFPLFVPVGIGFIVLVWAGHFLGAAAEYWAEKIVDLLP